MSKKNNILPIILTTSIIITTTYYFYKKYIQRKKNKEIKDILTEIIEKKNNGNNYFRNKKYHKALELYNECYKDINIILNNNNYDNNKDEDNNTTNNSITNNIDNINNNTDNDIIIEYKNILNNISVVYYILKEYNKSMRYLDILSSIDKYNIKMLKRKYEIYNSNNYIGNNDNNNDNNNIINNNDNDNITNMNNKEKNKENSLLLLFVLNIITKEDKYKLLANNLLTEIVNYKINNIKNNNHDNNNIYKDIPSITNIKFILETFNTLKNKIEEERRIKNISIEELYYNLYNYNHVNNDNGNNNNDHSNNHINNDNDNLIKDNKDKEVFLDAMDEEYKSIDNNIITLTNPNNNIINSINILNLEDIILFKAIIEYIKDNIDNSILLLKKINMIESNIFLKYLIIKYNKDNIDNKDNNNIVINNDGNTVVNDDENNNTNNNDSNMVTSTNPNLDNNITYKYYSILIYKINNNNKYRSIIDNCNNIDNNRVTHTNPNNVIIKLLLLYLRVINSIENNNIKDIYNIYNNIRDNYNYNDINDNDGDNDSKNINDNNDSNNDTKNTTNIKSNNDSNNITKNTTNIKTKSNNDTKIYNIKNNNIIKNTTDNKNNIIDSIVNIKIEILCIIFEYLYFIKEYKILEDIINNIYSIKDNNKDRNNISTDCRVFLFKGLIEEIKNNNPSSYYKESIKIDKKYFKPYIFIVNYLINNKDNNEINDNISVLDECKRYLNIAIGCANTMEEYYAAVQALVLLELQENVSMYYPELNL